MRKLLDQKFWSLGTNLGDPRALGATPVVLVSVRMLILFTFVMIYMTPHPIALENFFAKELASVPMWHMTKADKMRGAPALFGAGLYRL